MPNYLNYLQSISNQKTFRRKRDYFKYNYGKIFSSKVTEGFSALEIGPGLGEFVSYLNSLHINTIDIVDNDHSILEYISSHFTINRAINTEDISETENELQKYNLIVLTQVLEHVPKAQYKKFLSTLYNHLNDGGILIITVPNMGNPFTLCELYADLTHHNGFTDVSLKELVNTCELKNTIAIVHNFNIPPYSIINLIRIVFQKIFHGILLVLSMINGGTYSKFLTPNITLILKKK